MSAQRPFAGAAGCVVRELHLLPMVKKLCLQKLLEQIKVKPQHNNFIFYSGELREFFGAGMSKYLGSVSCTCS